MNGDRSHFWALRILTTAAVMLLFVLAAPTATADPQPGPTSIRVTAQMSPEFEVTASGLLTDRDGRAVPDALVQAKVNGAPAADATTGADGTYQIAFTLPEDLRAGEQQLVVIFGGRDGLDASQASTTIPAAENPPTQADSPTPPPAPARAGVVLEVSIAPELVPLGGLVMVDGVLTAEDGTAVPDARIVLLLDGQESADSLALTGPDGTFQTFAEIPSDQPAGEAQLVVSFTGSDTYAPSEKAVTVNVEELPMAEKPQASATATGSVGAEPDATGQATAESTGGAAETEPVVDPNPLSWFYVTLIVVGGIALLIAAALVFRAMYGRREPARGSGETLDLLLRSDPDADADPDAGADEPGLISDTFGEEIPLPEADDTIGTSGTTAAASPPGGTAQVEPVVETPPRRSAD